MFNSDNRIPLGELSRLRGQFLEAIERFKRAGCPEEEATWRADAFMRMRYAAGARDGQPTMHQRMARESSRPQVLIERDHEHAPAPIHCQAHADDDRPGLELTAYDKDPGFFQTEIRKSVNSKTRMVSNTAAKKGKSKGKGKGKRQGCRFPEQLDLF